MDGGSFDISIDGGGTVATYSPIRIHDDTEVSVSFQYLYDSGNLILRSLTGQGYEITVGTGKFSKFYKIIPSVTSNSYDLNLNEQSYSILPSNNYKVYSDPEKIVYILTGELSTVVSGRTAANQIKNTTVFASSELQTSGILQSTLNYYDYSSFQSPSRYDIIPSQHLLYVYNLNSQESIDIKNYYFQMRTGITGANILGINCNIGYSGEITDTGNYVNNIRTPIHRFIMTGNKPIKYACLFHGIPTQITGSPFTTNYASGLSGAKLSSTSICFDLSHSLAQYSGYARSNQFTYPRAFYQKNTYRYNQSPSIERPFLFEEFTGTTTLFTHICSLQNRAADVSGYIRKICQDGVVSGVYLLGSGNNNSFLCYSNDGTNFYNNRVLLATFEADRNLDFYNNLGVNISLLKPRVEKPEMTGYNVGGFTSDGWHRYLFTGGTGANTVDSAGGGWESSSVYCNLSGYNWYLSSHYESLAGTMITFEFKTAGEEMLPHSPVSKQIKATAMGGTNYSNIPVGFVGSMLEPGYQGIEKIKMFDAWFKGLPFIESAYIGMQVTYTLVMGDPLLKWK